MQFIKKKKTFSVDREKFTHVCMDDFALKKRKKYGTIMVDIGSHRIIDMIDSREYEEVKKWLETYPNLEVVSRDGSITYRKAITDAQPQAIQVNARFHLVKNLVAYARDYLKRTIKPCIEVPIDQTETIQAIPKPACKADENRKRTRAERYELAKELQAQGHSKTTICKNINMDVRTYNKFIISSTECQTINNKTKQEITHDEKVHLKKERVEEVRNFKNMHLSDKEIARRTGLDRRTVKKYIDVTYNPVHAAYGQKKEGCLTPYSKSTEYLLEQEVSGTKIERHIRSLGYKASSSTVRHYITDWKKNHKRGYEQDTRSTTQCPTLKMKRDIESVRHAIALEYNNGLAEGSVNKLKVIKRIMYGRCSFGTLRTKVLYLEKVRHIT